MRKACAIAFLVTLMISASPEAAAQIWMTGGNALMTINTALPGQQPLPIGNTSTGMLFITGAATRKISVATICPGQHFTLSVLATNPSIGIAAPEVQLTDGMLGLDFITEIPPGLPFLGFSTLQYTASATFEQGNSLELGDDLHTVTYTITDQ